MASKHSRSGEYELVPFSNISPEQQPLLRTVEPYNTSADQKDTYDSGKQCLAVNRKKLQETLYQYTFDTLGHIATVSEFCLSCSEWEKEMTENINKLNVIKEKEEGESKNKIEGALKSLKNKLTPQCILDRRREELQQELDDVFNVIIRDLEKLKEFVDAVERLAVTSLHVFEENNQVLQLPEETSLENVQAIIKAAIQVSPRILQFKREARTFFSPNLHNVAVHSVYLDKYKINTKTICDMMESSVRKFEKMKNTKTVVQLPADLSEVDIQDMLHHIECLTDDIRKDQDFRVGFLLQDCDSSVFSKEYSDTETTAQQLLPELEKIAVQLDRIKKGSLISSVLGSSVGVISGVLTISALLTPTSLGLFFAGLVLGVTSAINGIVTKSTELGVNATQQKKAKNLFNNFVKDVENKALTKYINKTKLLGAITNVYRVYSGIKAIVIAIAILQSPYFYYIGQRAVEPMDMIPVDMILAGIFAVAGIGLNMYAIITESMDLAKGSRSKVSQFIRDRASLFRSDLDSWKEIHDSLIEGMTTSEEKKNKLDFISFYPVDIVNKHTIHD